MALFFPIFFPFPAASARRLFLVAVSAFWALSLFLPEAADAAKFIVGGDSNWTIPTEPTLYAGWAAGKTFAVGDFLVFNFKKNNHNVLRVASATPGSCNASEPIGTAFIASPATIMLTEAGAHYYICNVTGHCDAGQVLAINVSAESTAALGPSSSSAPTPVSGGSFVPAAPVPDSPQDGGSSSSPDVPSGSSMPPAPESGSAGFCRPFALSGLVAWLAVAYALIFV